MESEIIKMLNMQIDELTRSRDELCEKLKKKIVYNWRCQFCIFNFFCKKGKCPSFISKSNFIITP